VYELTPVASTLARDRITVFNRLVQSLQEDGAGPLTSATPVTALVEGFALTITRQELPFAHADRILVPRQISWHP
jgi:hypothetical protein